MFGNIQVTPEYVGRNGKCAAWEEVAAKEINQQKAEGTVMGVETSNQQQYGTDNALE